MKKILMVFGTRPEAIKMCDLYKEIAKSKKFMIQLCVTAQHRDMLDDVLNVFSITPEYDLNLMKKKQSLTDLTSNILRELDIVLDDSKPDLVLVHGDTTTTFCASLASFYKKIDVGHIEAGLRTGDIYSPWPEEINRRLTGSIAKFHFAPTIEAKNNLLREGVLENKIYVTGNTVIDSLLKVENTIKTDNETKRKLDKSFNFLSNNKDMVLITGHRRENFGKSFENICYAIKSLANKFKNINFVYPVHLNPNVQEPVNKLLNNLDNVFLLSPQGYLPFVYLMTKSKIILTDSGGIQEEAPSLGKPVFVMRDTTERPEAVNAGTVRVIGTSKRQIIDSVEKILTDSEEYNKMSRSHNPYGDGKACKRIVKNLEENI